MTALLLLLAQAGTPDLLTPLLQYGGLGVFSAWLMFRIEKRMDKITDALIQLTRSQTLLSLNLPNLTEAGRAEAGSINRNLDELEKK